MDYKELIEALKSMLPEKVLYGDLIGAEGVYAHSGPLVYEDPEPYFIEQAITAINDLLARAEEAEAQRDEAVHDRMMMEQRIGELNARAEKAERERDAAIQYMRKTFGWCTGCVHFTGIYGSGCKIGEMSTCGEENNRYVFCKEE